MPKLIVKSGAGVVKELPLDKEKFTIGRMPDNDLELRDSLVSRRHTELIRHGTRVTLYDMGSSNGTFVNNKKVDVKVLDDGDEVTIGETTLIFRDDSGNSKPATATPAAVAPPANIDQEIEKMYGGSEIIKQISEVPEEYKVDLRESIAKGISWRKLSRTKSAIAATDERVADKFNILYQLGKAVAKATSLSEVCNIAMSVIFDVMKAERGVIMLLDRSTDTLVPKIMRHRQKGTITGDEVVASRTIANKVVREKISIITNDAKHDPRFQTGASIIQYNIRSALCVPLWEQQEVLGCIYLDNLVKSYEFQEDDIELLTAIANILAIRIKQDELYEELKREALTRANLERYNSPDVVEMILRRTAKGKGTLEMEAEEREVSILFADIEGFTPMTEKMEPTQVGRMLNTFFEVTSRVVLESQGNVNKFIGDCIMAVYGAPVEMQDHAVRAARAGLRMIEELRKTREKHPDFPKFNVRIGINSGNVVAGDIGFEKRREYTVLGDNVNIASRLEKYAKPNQVVVGERTHTLIHDNFECRFLESVRLKGKEREVKVYEVVAPK